MKRTVITPRTLRGFADVMPSTGRRRRQLLEVLEEVYTSFGFDPIQTPAVEYAEVLKGKGGTESDKQMFEFEDKGGRQVALRFDLTVPLARFVAQHESELTFPFRAYNIGYVWRGDRPQRGRYREFLQSDADIIGESGITADAEILTVIATALARMEIGPFTIRLNNRKILNGVLTRLDLQDRVFPVLRALDKVEKTGPAAVAAELAEAGITAAAAQDLLALVGSMQASNEASLSHVEASVRGSAEGEAGVAEVREVIELVSAALGKPAPIRFDPSIVRGLDYYTGIVFEALHDEAPEVGSISGGGRYDDLASVYTTSRLPGVGATIGVSRILSILEGLGRLGDRPRGRALVVLTQDAEADRSELMRLAASIRGAGAFDVELYPAAVRHATQMKYGDARGARFLLTLDADGTMSVKDMESGERASAAPAEVPALLSKLAGGEEGRG
jgi:histidyl-tRNA synthetase